MPSLPCESTQNLLPNDTHLVLLPNRQWDMMSSCYVMKVLKNSFLMIPISYFTKKGNVHTCTDTFTSFSKWQGWNLECNITPTPCSSPTTLHCKIFANNEADSLAFQLA